MKPNSKIDVSAAEIRFGGGTFGFVRVVGYRLYGLDGVNKVVSAEWIEAEGDSDAIAVAKEKMDGQPVELWQGSRLVARFKRSEGIERARTAVFRPRPC